MVKSLAVAVSLMGLMLGAAGEDPPLLLAGPKVVEAPTPASLVVRDFEGRLQQLADPAHEAILLLNLSDHARQRVAALRQDRRQEFAAISRANLAEIISVAEGFKSGRPSIVDVARGLILLSRYRAYFDRGCLIDEAAPLLGDQVVVARQLLGEYSTAAVVEMGRELGDRATAKELTRRLWFAQQGALLRELIEEQGAMADDNFTYFADDLGLDDVQRGELKRIIEPIYVQDVIGGGAPVRERLAAIREGWLVLNHSQQSHLLARAFREIEKRVSKPE